MSFRTVMITKHCKLYYNNGYLVVRAEDVTKIHLSEIHTLIIDSTMVLITAYALCEMIKNKIKIIFCDEKRNPYSELVPYNSFYHASKTIKNQIKWDRETCKEVFKKIIQNKLHNQALALKDIDKERSETILCYENSVLSDDSSNREGHGSKVYFNSMFGKEFVRHESDPINHALDYGYSIILSTFNKCIVDAGYLTQIGIHHKGEFNPFNLSCDFMEPYRIIVDVKVRRMAIEFFDNKVKGKLVNILNERVNILNKNYRVAKAIQISTKSIIKALNDNKVEEVKYFSYEKSMDESDCFL